MQKKLLAVEDNQGIADIIRHVGIIAGFETRIATTDKQFIQIYTDFIPEILILDIIMPGMDGFEILNFLKERSSKAQIVILSGQEDFRRMAGDLGQQYGLSIVANLAKPFRIENLRQTLEQIKEHGMQDLEKIRRD